VGSRAKISQINRSSGRLVHVIENGAVGVTEMCG
jgi:hypothetical protein